MSYSGTTFDPALDEARLNEQTVRVYRAMLDEQWHSLYELTLVTGDPLQSISARLRDLRKPEFGGFAVLRRRRVGSDAVWEYQMLPAASEPEVLGKSRRSGFLAGLMHAAKIAASSADLPTVKLKLKGELIKAAHKRKTT